MFIFKVCFGWFLQSFLMQDRQSFLSYHNYKWSWKWKTPPQWCYWQTFWEVKSKWSETMWISIQCPFGDDGFDNGFIVKVNFMVILILNFNDTNTTQHSISDHSKTQISDSNPVQKTHSRVICYWVLLCWRSKWIHANQLGVQNPSERSYISGTPVSHSRVSSKHVGSHKKKLT